MQFKPDSKSIEAEDAKKANLLKGAERVFEVLHSVALSIFMGHVTQCQLDIESTRATNQRSIESTRQATVFESHENKTVRESSDSYQGQWVTLVFPTKENRRKKEIWRTCMAASMAESIRVIAPGFSSKACQFNKLYKKRRRPSSHKQKEKGKGKGEEMRGNLIDNISGDKGVTRRLGADQCVHQKLFILLL